MLADTFSDPHANHMIDLSLHQEFMQCKWTALERLTSRGQTQLFQLHVDNLKFCLSFNHLIPSGPSAFTFLSLHSHPTSPNYQGNSNFSLNSASDFRVLDQFNPSSPLHDNWRRNCKYSGSLGVLRSALKPAKLLPDSSGRPRYNVFLTVGISEFQKNKKFKCLYNE